MSPANSIDQHGDSIIQGIDQILEIVVGQRVPFALFAFGDGGAGTVGNFLSNCRKSNALANIKSAVQYMETEPAGPPSYSSPVLTEIARERIRQVEVKGYSTKHDDNQPGELAAAASCYALTAGACMREAAGGVLSTAERYQAFDAPPAPLWPWDTDAWRPKDPRRDLVRAAALILAEIERIDRATAG